MKFMAIVHATAESEAGIPPKPELMAAVGKLAEEGFQSGTIVANDGLLPSSQGVRLKLSDGKITATHGPFTEAKEIVGGFAIMKLDSKEEAVKACKDFMQVHADIMGRSYKMSCEIRPMFDLGDACGPLTR